MLNCTHVKPSPTARSMIGGRSRVGGGGDEADEGGDGEGGGGKADEGGDGEGGGGEAYDEDVGGDGEGGGGEAYDEDEEDEDERQIVKPDLVTEPSVYHVIVAPELMLTPLGPLVPEYLLPPTVM